MALMMVGLGWAVAGCKGGRQRCQPIRQSCVDTAPGLGDWFGGPSPGPECAATLRRRGGGKQGPTTRLTQLLKDQDGAEEQGTSTNCCVLELQKPSLLVVLAPRQKAVLATA